MIPDSLFAPLMMAVAALPLFVLGIAVRRGNLGLINGLEADRVRDRDAVAARLGNWLLLMGAALLASGPGYVWAGADKGRVQIVTLAMVLAITAIALKLVFDVAAVKRDYKPLPRTK